MPRTKERRKIDHTPSTPEILICLNCMPLYKRILADHRAGKLYSDFLKWLIEKDLYKVLEEKITIKKIAADFKNDTARVTKWIREICDDIFELNYEKPELFQKSGTKVDVDFRNYDDYCTFYTSLPVVPREFEKVSFPFVKAKVGIEWFWVKNS
ncbi:MAG: hypothetical protein Q8891_17635 [Bacteroidota bacterium]|nr:hypothetical protein [Bacteroidota bacterium]